MKPLILIGYLIPFILFLLRRFVSIIIILPFLIVGTIITYYFYRKNPDKNLSAILSLYGFNYFFIIISILFRVIYQF